MPHPRVVLIVEDHDGTRHMVQEDRAFWGIPAIGAENGEHRWAPCGDIGRR